MSSQLAPLLVIGVGASSGGLNALKRFFTTIPKDAPMAFILVQLLEPDLKSMMSDILTRQTDLFAKQNNKKARHWQ